MAIDIQSEPSHSKYDPIIPVELGREFRDHLQSDGYYHISTQELIEKGYLAQAIAAYFFPRPVVLKGDIPADMILVDHLATQEFGSEPIDDSAHIKIVGSGKPAIIGKNTIIDAQYGVGARITSYRYPIRIDSSILNAGSYVSATLKPITISNSYIEGELDPIHGALTITGSQINGTLHSGLDKLVVKDSEVNAHINQIGKMDLIEMTNSHITNDIRLQFADLTFKNCTYESDVFVHMKNPLSKIHGNCKKWDRPDLRENFEMSYEEKVQYFIDRRVIQVLDSLSDGKTKWKAADIDGGHVYTTLNQVQNPQGVIYHIGETTNQKIMPPSGIGKVTLAADAITLPMLDDLAKLKVAEFLLPPDIGMGKQSA